MSMEADRLSRRSRSTDSCVQAGCPAAGPAGIPVPFETRAVSFSIVGCNHRGSLGCPIGQDSEAGRGPIGTVEYLPCGPSRAVLLASVRRQLCYRIQSTSRLTVLLQLSYHGLHSVSTLLVELHTPCQGLFERPLACLLSVWISQAPYVPPREYGRSQILKVAFFLERQGCCTLPDKLSASFTRIPFNIQPSLPSLNTKLCETACRYGLY